MQTHLRALFLCCVALTSSYAFAGYSCIQHCVKRTMSGTCVEYGPDVCGENPSTTQICVRRDMGGVCLEWGADLFNPGHGHHGGGHHGGGNNSGGNNGGSNNGGGTSSGSPQGPVECDDNEFRDGNKCYPYEKECPSGYYERLGYCIPNPPDTCPHGHRSLITGQCTPDVEHPVWGDIFGFDNQGSFYLWGWKDGRIDVEAYGVVLSPRYQVRTYKAVVTTVLKTENVQSSQLSYDEKCTISAGTLVSAVLKLNDRNKVDAIYLVGDTPDSCEHMYTRYVPLYLYEPHFTYTIATKKPGRAGQ